MSQRAFESSRRRVALALAVTSAAAALAASPVARAAPVHVYTFNDGTANDSVGTANGTLANGATITGGALSTNGTGNTTTPASLDDAPAANLTGAAVTGLTGDFTVEQFFTRAAAGAQFQTGFSFATNTGNYLIMSPARGGTAIGAAFNQQSVNSGVERVIAAPAPALNTPTYFATTYSAASGTGTLHVNGALQGGFTSYAGYDLSTKNTRLGINGNAPFNDASLNGTTDEFRVYDNVESATTVALRFLGGNLANNPVVTNTATASGDFNAAGNYSNGAPTASQRVVVPAGTTLDLASGTGTAGLLEVSGGTVNVNGGTLTSATNIDLSAGAIINVNAGGTFSPRGVSSNGSAFSTAAGSAINLNGGALLTPAGFNSYLASPNVALNVNAPTTVTANNTMFVGATLVGTPALTKSGTADLNVISDTTGFTGAFNVTAGVLNLNLPAARVGANAIANAFTLSSTSSVLTFGGNVDVDFAGTLTATATAGQSIRKNEGGRLTFRVPVSVPGEIIANAAGELGVAANVTVGTNTGLAGFGGTVADPRTYTVSNGATLDSAGTGRFLFVDSGNNQDTQFVELSGNSSVTDLQLYVKGRSTIPGIAGFTFTDADRPTSGLVLSNLSGNNTYAGGISIRAGGGGYSIRSQAGTLSIGGNTFNNITGGNRGFELTGPGNGVFTGTVSDNTTGLLYLAMIGETNGTATTGAGTFTLANGTNSFSGGITVINGTFNVDGATTSTSAATSNRVSVYGGTLGGTGSVSQAVTVFGPGVATTAIPGTTPPVSPSTPFATVAETLSLGGTLDPGNATTPIESLAIGSTANPRSLTFSGAGTLDLDYDGAAAGQQVDSVLIAGGSAAFGTTAVLDFDLLPGGSPLTAASYLLATYASFSGAFGTVTDLPAGYQLVYGTTALTLELIPEPSVTLGAMTLLGTVALKRRRTA